MAAAYLVPEVPERLILIDFWDDDIPWHIRMVLQNTGAPGVWIASSSDMGVARLDLNEHRILMLQGGAVVPPDYAGQYSYCFDSPIDPVELALIRAESREVLALLGLSTSSIAPEGSTWRLADTVDPNLRDPVPAEALSQPAVFKPEGSSALI